MIKKESRKTLTELISCLKCNCKLVIQTEITIIGGKSYPMEVKKCVKCGEIYINPLETERIRKLAYPSLWDRLKNPILSLVNSNQDEKLISLFEGKVL